MHVVINVMVSLLEASAWQTPLLESKRQRAPDWDTEDALAFKQLPPDGDRRDNRKNELAPRRASLAAVERLSDVEENDSRDLTADRELKRAHPQLPSPAADNPYGHSMLRDRVGVATLDDMDMQVERHAAHDAKDEAFDLHRVHAIDQAKRYSDERMNRGGDNMHRSARTAPTQMSQSGAAISDAAFPSRVRANAEPNRSRQSTGNTLHNKLHARSNASNVDRVQVRTVEYVPISTAEGVKLLRVGGRAAIPTAHETTTRPGSVNRDDPMRLMHRSDRYMESEPVVVPFRETPRTLNESSERRHFENDTLQSKASVDPVSNRIMGESGFHGSKQIDPRANHETIIDPRATPQEVTGAPTYKTDLLIRAMRVLCP